MRIEVLYIADCPNHQVIVDRVRDVLRSTAISEQVEEIEVRISAQAETLQFIGSPTVRINGMDVEYEARSIRHYGLGCRVYQEGDSRSNLPSANLLRRLLSE